MSSDYKYYFGFVVKEIFELGHTIKSRCFFLNNLAREYSMLKLEEFVQFKTKTLFRIAWHFSTNTENFNCNFCRYYSMRVDSGVRARQLSKCGNIDILQYARKFP